MKKYLKWGAVILVLVVLLALNVAPVFGRNNQSVAAASLAPGEPAQGEIYVRNVADTPAAGSCSTCPYMNGGVSSTASTGGQPSCH